MIKNAKDSLVECVTAAGEPMEGRLLRLGRFDAVFEVPGGFDRLRASEALGSLKIISGARLLYEGRATVRKLVDAEAGQVCEVALSEAGVNLEMLPSPDAESYETFTQQWLAAYRIAPEFKLVVADAGILLNNVRQWMNQLELAIRAAHPQHAPQKERECLARVTPRFFAAFDAQLERFEEQSSRLSPDLRGAHQNHAAREWSSFFLAAPFGHRTFYKPLGYAGDYEMMDMIYRNGPEGGSLFAKTMHLLLMKGWPAESVRNRIGHLRELLVSETARAVRSGRRSRILNLGCGPAREVQEFMDQSALSDEADFTLLDFNDETIRFTGGKLHEAKRRAGRRTGLVLRQMNVHQILRAALAQQSAGAPLETYDLIYCAGLFDYLADTTCKALVKLFCHWLAPGGLTVVANMNDSKPFRNFIEFLLDWHLIYRDTRAMWAMCPAEFAPQAAVLTEPTTVNLFLNVRRPE